MTEEGNSTTAFASVRCYAIMVKSWVDTVTPKLGNKAFIRSFVRSFARLFIRSFILFLQNTT